MEKPLIFVTNDDGISSPGILFLVSIAKQFGEVVVIAPDSPQSGMGHAITINSTIRVNEILKTSNKEIYSCTGTPVDCIKMAMNKFAKKKPDLIVSGINHGSNSSINVIYSGTMSAAMEGCIEGVPSIGFSLCNYSYEADFETSKPYIKQIAAKVLKEGLPEGTCLNVNIPSVAAEEIKGIKICRQAYAKYEEDFVERKDPHGRKYFWLTGEFVNFDKGKDTDVWALAHNYVSVVPVQFDMTNYVLKSKFENTWQHLS